MGIVRSPPDPCPTTTILNYCGQAGMSVGQGTDCVEVRRVELLSKHILQKLSTCLFCFIVSETNWRQTTD